MIEGGYYIKARKIRNGEIAHAPPHVREIWDWLIQEANHKDNGKIKRGQTIRSYRDIQESLKWYVGFRKEIYSKWQCEIAMKWLVKHEMVTTTKTTRGLLITICNYEYYQDPKNYENHIEDHTRTTREPQGTDTINKNGRKEEDKLNTLSDPSESDPKPKKEETEIYKQTQECLPFARTLARIIQSQKNIDITPEKKQSWAKEIRKLVFTSEKVGKDRVEKALMWYRKNVGGEYIPVIESGKSLRDKFTKLEAAIERDKPRNRKGYTPRHGVREIDSFEDKSDIEMTIIPK